MEPRDQQAGLEDESGAALLLAEAMTPTEDHNLVRQQYAHMTVKDSARLHAGNSYVGHQHNYYAPPTHREGFYPTDLSLKNAVAFPDMNLRSVSIAREQSQTCEWLFETPEYKRWRNPAFRSLHHGILWIRGKPGAGKSTLMKYAVRKHREDSKRHDRQISFFFNARGKSALEKSTEGMYRALLHQVVEEVPQLQDMAEPEARESFHKQGWPLELLKNMFREAMLFCGRKDTLTCYIDALDECDEDEMREMLSMLEDLGEEATSAGVALWICVASRHYPNIRISNLEEILFDDLEGHQEDISLYVQKRLKLQDFGDKLDLAEEIRQRSSGVFLWVVLVVAILNKVRDHGNIHQLRDRLLKIPTSLRDLFDDILNRDESNESLTPMIQWTLCAGRRLTALELYFAVLISTKQLKAAKLPWDSTLVSRHVLRDFILTGSKGFLEMSMLPLDGRPDELQYQFIHESVREFFIDHGLQRLDPSIQGKVVAASHERLAGSCIQYISLLSTALADASTDSAAQNMYPFLGYICHYGGFYHAEQAESRGLCQSTFCNTFPLDDWILVQVLTQESGPALHYVEYHATLLHILIEQEYQNLAKRVVRENTTSTSARGRGRACIDAHYGHLGTALHMAVERNNHEILRILLDCGANTTVQCGDLGTALHLAVSRNHMKAIHTLLSGGAEIDALHENNGTALHIAVTHSYTEVVSLLLTSGADVNVFLGGVGTALHAAVLYHHPKIAKLLIDSGADVDARHSDEKRQMRSETPLHIAVGRLVDDPEVTRVLLENGADINVQRKRERVRRPALSETALHIALRGRNLAVTHVLVESGADLKICRQPGETVSKTAAESSPECVRCLLERNANLNIWNRADFGDFLKTVAKVSNQAEQILHLLIEFNVLATISHDDMFAALEAASTRDRLPVAFMEIVLQQLPDSAHSDSKYDRVMDLFHQRRWISPFFTLKG